MKRIALSLLLFSACHGKASMQIGSPAFNQGGTVPSQYTCDAENVPPPIWFRGAPPASKSVAIVLDDSDVPKGVFTHWLVWNIRPGAASLLGASQGTNDFGRQGYSGPCPPHGRHRYVLHFLALDDQLPLGSSATRRDFDRATEGHVLGEARLAASYTRRQAAILGFRRAEKAFSPSRRSHS